MVTLALIFMPFVFLPQLKCQPLAAVFYIGCGFLASLAFVVNATAYMRHELPEARTNREGMNNLQRTFAELTVRDRILAVVAGVAFSLGAWGVESRANLVGLSLTYISLLLPALLRGRVSAQRQPAR